MADPQGPTPYKKTPTRIVPFYGFPPARGNQRICPSGRGSLNGELAARAGRQAKRTLVARTKASLFNGMAIRPQEEPPPVSKVARLCPAPSLKNGRRQARSFAEVTPGRPERVSRLECRLFSGSAL